MRGRRTRGKRCACRQSGSQASCRGPLLRWPPPGQAPRDRGDVRRSRRLLCACATALRGSHCRRICSGWSRGPALQGFAFRHRVYYSATASRGIHCSRNCSGRSGGTVLQGSVFRHSIEWQSLQQDLPRSEQRTLLQVVWRRSGTEETCFNIRPPRGARDRWTLNR